MSYSPLAITTFGMLAPDEGVSVTYLAAGTRIDVTSPQAPIDIDVSASLDLSGSGTDIDLVRAGAKLEVTNDGNRLDIQR